MKLQIEFEGDIQVVSLIPDPIFDLVININPASTIII